MTTSVEIRDELVSNLRRDLIGPSPDQDDADLWHEVLDKTPSRWYMTGYLAPREGAPMAQPGDDDESLRQGSLTSPDDEVVDTDAGTGSGEDDGAPNEETARRRIKPTTLGLSATVPIHTRTIEALVEWGDYVAEPPIPEAVLQGEGTEEEKKLANKVKWRRKPRSSRSTIDLEEVRKAGGEKTYPLPDSTGIQRRGGALELYVVCKPAQRYRPERKPEDVWAVTVMVVNARSETHRYRDVTYAFQVRLTLACADGFCSQSDETGYGDTDEDRRLHDLHYRDVRTHAQGRNTAADHEADADGVVRRIRTEPLPSYDVEKVAQNKALENIGVTFSMNALAAAAKAGPEELYRALSAFPEHYREWIAAQRERLGEFDELPRRRETAERVVRDQDEACVRMARGIELLRDNAAARDAFLAMNEAVSNALMRRLNVNDPVWRPFQLAFILINLCGLTECTDDEREIVDLLFFPTGGGKTEAYLGLAAYSIALRRLRAPGLMGSGVSVIMRYTLRLLTLDQLGRAAGVVCALELMRQSEEWRSEHGEYLLGDWPIEIGLWVGARGTPNRLGGIGNSDERSAYTRVTRHQKDRRKNSAPAPIRECPWCRAELQPTSFSMWPNNRYPSRMLIQCLNPECDFTGRNPLPVLAVDEEIFHRLPAFVVATVDKFAQLPWKGETGAFFANVDRVDEEGHRFYGADFPDRGKVMQPGECLPPPELIIQDELHLISGPLGTVVGLYEAAVDVLATRNVNNKPVRPKIVASTATVRRARDQITALFDRAKTAIFPPPGIDQRDSYFAVTERAEDQPARRYIGIAALGQGPRVVFMRTLITLLANAQFAHDRAGAETPSTSDHNPADPYTTAVCYFNALRELGGARRIVEDEVRERARRYGSERVRLEPAEQTFADRDIGAPVELTSRVSTDDVALAKQRLETPYGAKAHTDVALATNMISVGLDIERLGLMLVQGQPKSAAEYIQATSRVGRASNWPGLVVTILNVHKPRDKAHYEDFAGYHAAFYRAVEATSVTPWSTRALDRALVAALVATIRHTDEAMTPEDRAGQLIDHEDAGERARDWLLQRAGKHLTPGGLTALRERIDRLLGVWATLADAQTEAGGSLRYGGAGSMALLHQPLDPDIDPVSGSLDPSYRHFQAAWSMRDVEAPVALEIRTPAGQPLFGEGRQV